jgi:enoyl-CoA hydratase/carnithine racemase
MPQVRLGDIAHARSGDKGAGANVGVIANTAADFEVLRRCLTPQAVETFFQPLGVGHVVRYELPNLLALNFVLPKILDGGGSLTLRTDAQGKSLGQSLLEMRLDVPNGALSPETPGVPCEAVTVIVDNADPRITVIALNRPKKRNALNLELIEALYHAVVATENDRNRRAILLRGNGPVFCAGLDLGEAADAGLAERSARALARLYGAIWRSRLVTLAAAHGAAVGGGAGLLAACDCVVAADDLRIGFPEVRRGLVAALVACMLRRQVGDRVLREWLLWGQTVSAPQALAAGLVNHVRRPSEMLSAAMERAQEACNGVPGAIAQTKRLLDELSARTIEVDLELALRHHLEARNSNEASEGIAAFGAKREPYWRKC